MSSTLYNLFSAQCNVLDCHPPVFSQVVQCESVTLSKIFDLVMLKKLVWQYLVFGILGNSLIHSGKVQLNVMIEKNPLIDWSNFAIL